MHEYEINDYFEEWYDDDMNEFRYGNRCTMMVYGLAIYAACFFIPCLAARLFNVHPLWAFWCNGSTFYLLFKTIFTPGGMKDIRSRDISIWVCGGRSSGTDEWPRQSS